MLSAQHYRSQFAHLFDEPQADLKPLRQRHFAQRSDLFEMQFFAHP
jgi:hypothetical protein